MGKIIFKTPEERIISAYLSKHLRLKDKKNKEEHLQYFRDIMRKRRKEGKTQKANREYAVRNKTAISMYMAIIYAEPDLRRRGWRRRPEEDTND